METKLTLQQRMQQKLSPQQIQMIKMIEVPMVELEQRIDQELQENPALEEGEELDDEHAVMEQEEEHAEDEKPIRDDMDYEDYMGGGDDTADVPDYRMRVNNQSRDERGTREEIPFSIGTSFHEFLNDQLSLRNLSEQDRRIAEFIVGNIEEDGYLRREDMDIVDDLAFKIGLEVTEEQVKQMVKVVQSLDPAGVGARTLQECLLLQLSRREQTPSVVDAQKILSEHFDLFARKHYDKLQKRSGLTEKELKAAVAEVTKLTPKPGASFGTVLDKNKEQVVPDFIVAIDDDGSLVVSLNNDTLPELRVSKTYKEMLKEYSQDKSGNRQMKDAAVFVRQKVDAAQWFIDALKQRNRTMMNVMESIVKRQSDFFLKGDESLLKPMILKDIAEATDLDISTVSRVSNSKYVQTQFGVWPLKHFFSEAMLMEDGEEVSSRSIKSILKQYVESEDKKHPIPDERLMEILKEKGFVIARRTVAKYREQLGIPVARLRKEV